MVAHRLGDALPGRFVFCRGAHSQERAEVLEAAGGLARLIDVKTVDNERPAILRNLGARRRNHLPGNLHSQKLVQGNKWQILR